MGRPIKPRVYVWRISLEGHYFGYSMDCPGRDPEEALAYCEQQINHMDYDGIRIVSDNPTKISTFTAYCGGVIGYLIPVHEFDEDSDVLL